MTTPLDRLRARLARKAAARRARGDAPNAEPPAAASPAEAPPPVPEPPVPAEPRLVRRIVWAYEVGVLPVPWLMGYKRLKAMVERAGFAVRVDLTPLSSLPADTDVLCVPDELAAAARETAPDAYLLALEGRPPQDALQALVDQLRANTELTAERAAATGVGTTPEAPAEPGAELDVAASPPAEPGTAAEPTAGSAQPRTPFTPARGKVVRYRGWERLD
jgi:hypothetical protein